MRRDAARNGTRSRIAGTVGSLVLASVLAACGGMKAKDAGPPEELIKARAQERWNALLAGDVPKVYGFMSPTAREALSLEAFRGAIRIGFFKSAEVVKVECQPDVCDVQLQVTYVYRGSSIVTPVRESWVRSDGGWWHVFKPA